jgi:hypothetical protein
LGFPLDVDHAELGCHGATVWAYNFDFGCFSDDCRKAKIAPDERRRLASKKCLRGGLGKTDDAIQANDAHAVGHAFDDRPQIALLDGRLVATFATRTLFHPHRIEDVIVDYRAGETTPSWQVKVRALKKGDWLLAIGSPLAPTNS